MKALEVILGWTLPHALVKKISNDCAFSLIADEAGEGIEMLEVLHRVMTTVGCHCGLIPQTIEDDCGNLVRLCQIGGDNPDSAIPSKVSAPPMLAMPVESFDTSRSGADPRR